MKRRKGFYSISVVSKMFNVHQQTVRMYEKEGLICPKRTEGNTRLFSEEDVDRLEQVINLTHKMGVNIAGVQMILKMQSKIKKMQDEMNKMFETAHGQLAQEGEDYKMLVAKDGQELFKLKQECLNNNNENKTNKDTSEKEQDFSDWEIDYEQDK
ncbi:MAG: Transcriptional regulator (MerR family) [candidate division TM6 bacterium GW2011_GWF2_28_16]|nr:MAG: Transcriptional regulator (MerR family) [candidate division TM6 bacterium GW2011_GWF2_28_16]